MHLPKSFDRAYPARQDLLPERRLRRSLRPGGAYLCIATNELGSSLATSQIDARPSATFVTAAGMDSNSAMAKRLCLSDAARRPVLDQFAAVFRDILCSPDRPSAVWTQ